MNRKERLILALNCGSSSLKFGFFQYAESSISLLCKGEAEEVGSAHSSFWIQRQGDKRKEEVGFPDHTSALTHVFNAPETADLSRPAAVGHRIVHGGRRIRNHMRVQLGTLNELRAAAAFAPLHLPPALTVLEAMQERSPDVPQIVCLDTAFHRNIPDVAKTFALPKEIRAMGVERYGFHGLSLESILAQLSPVPRRLIVAHLGNGSSITAIRDGQSIDTTMGLTPTGGVMMGTRCGDLDPGVMLFLIRNGFAAGDELESVVDHHSGLRGVSGVSSDVRELLSARRGNSQADLALRMFCYQVRKAIASLTAALGGLDMLVFTGGIGEHATDLRNEITAGLEVLGTFATQVLPAQEDLQIARIAAQYTACISGLPKV